ncbi:hypothetical protein ES703_112974 [subsurface metagenome]
MTQPGSLFGLSQNRAEHYCISPGGQGFTQVSTLTKTTVGNYRHVSARLTLIFFSSGGAVYSGCYLGDADAEDFSGGTGSTGPDTYQDSRDSRPHQFQTGAVADTVTGDNGDGYRFTKLRED